MISFTAKVSDLDKALLIVSTAASDKTDKIISHALFTVTETKCEIQATNEDCLAFTQIPVTNAMGTSKFKTIQFTAAPKNLLTAVSNSDRDEIKFEYETDTKTLKVYASDNDDAFLATPSFDPNGFLSFEDLISPTSVITGVNAEVFTAGLRFEQGFALKDEKNPKFSNIYIKEGAFYASDGAKWVGAFKCDDIANIFSLTVRRSMLSSILNILEKHSWGNVVLRDSDKIVLLTNSDMSSGFGYRKSTVEMPKLPISFGTPQGDGINIDREVLRKKIARLATVIKKDKPGVIITLEDNSILVMKTRSDRPSMEKMPCRRLSGDGPVRFILDESMVKGILPLFQASNIDLYIQPNRCTIYSTADQIIEDDTHKSFTAIALISLPREI
jgi:DNA polymerase III sliding clamp (beta) subunit (PCNA family)